MAENYKGILFKYLEVLNFRPACNRMLPALRSRQPPSPIQYLLISTHQAYKTKISGTIKLIINRDISCAWRSDKQPLLIVQLVA